MPDPEGPSSCIVTVSPSVAALVVVALARSCTQFWRRFFGVVASFPAGIVGFGPHKVLRSSAAAFPEPKHALSLPPQVVMCGNTKILWTKEYAWMEVGPWDGKNMM